MTAAAWNALSPAERADVAFKMMGYEPHWKDLANRMAKASWEQLTPLQRAALEEHA